jgi:hypothetical protein
MKIPKFENLKPKQYPNSNILIFKKYFNFDHCDLFRISSLEIRTFVGLA